MTANQAMFPIHAMRNAFGVSRSGYYAWAGRRPSAGANADAVLVECITALHRPRRRPMERRIHAELADEGVHVARKRVEWLMKAAGIAGVNRRRGARTTFRDNPVRPACDLVDRNFYADASDTLWVADITYVPTWAGFLYLAVVLDAFPPRIVGRAIGHDLRTQMVLDTLNMALIQRRPVSVIDHSYQGLQYTSVAFRLRCKEAGVRPSMRSVDDAYDNAMCESFFATLERELLDRRKFQTKAEARMAVFQFIEGWYNPGRRHSALGYQSPVSDERSAQERLESASPQLSTEPGELQLRSACRASGRSPPCEAGHSLSPVPSANGPG